jgi:hypothetical protein
MSDIYKPQFNKNSKAWVAWFIAGIGLTVLVGNPIFLILGTIVAVMQKHYLTLKQV